MQSKVGKRQHEATAALRILYVTRPQRDDTMVEEDPRCLWSLLLSVFNQPVLKKDTEQTP